MIHPYIDCARRLAAKGVRAEDIESITCDTSEGFVHRLWEPLDGKRKPPNAYAAKFSIPWCVGYGLIHGAVGLDAFTAERVQDPRVLEVASRVGYRVNPADPYPDEYTGHVRATLKDGRVVEERQPHLRGGQREPLARAELEEKFRGNCSHGGWSAELAERWLAFARGAFAAPIDLKPFRG
jgi:2-methylcitrate dehydratase PrpD